MAKTELDDLVSCGIDSKNRRIYFGYCTETADEESAEVSQRSVELAVRGLHRLASEGPGRPIELHMNSPGGDPYAMLRLVDEILACSCQVKFIGGGIIQSSATWIMCVCDERYLHPNTTVMVHDGTEYVDSTHTDAKIAMAEAVRLQNLLYDMYAANSRMPRAFWVDVCQRDLYLTAEETVKLGLADKVIEPKKRGNLRKMRAAALKKHPSHLEMQDTLNALYARVERYNVPKLELNKPIKEECDPQVKVMELTADPLSPAAGNPLDSDSQRSSLIDPASK